MSDLTMGCMLASTIWSVLKQFWAPVTHFSAKWTGSARLAGNVAHPLLAASLLVGEKRKLVSLTQTPVKHKMLWWDGGVVPVDSILEGREERNAAVGSLRGLLGE